MTSKGARLLQRSTLLCILVAGCTESPASPYVDIGINRPDIGMDGGTLPDAHVADMALTDAGFTDASVLDAYVADIGVADVGASDGAVADQGTVDPGPGRFDADLVYVFRWIPYQLTSVPVIDDFDGATQTVPGFEGLTYLRGVIRPDDGRIIFGESFASAALKVFVEDDWSGGGSPSYPDDPNANDITVSTSRCSIVDAHGVDPDSGEVLYDCLSCAFEYPNCYGRIFRSGGGEYLNVGASVRWWPGHDATTLFYANDTLLLYANGHTDVVAMAPSDLVDVVTARAIPSGFRVVARSDSGLDAIRVGANGSMVPEGSYPPLISHDRVSHARLAANGDLYIVAQTLDNVGNGRVVLRLVLGALTPAVVLSNADIRSSLISGP